LRMRDRVRSQFDFESVRRIPFDVGVNDGDRAANRQRAILNDVARIEMEIAKAGGFRAASLSQQIRMISAMSALEQGNLDIVRQRAELEREEKQLIIDKSREMQRMLMLGRPADLLRSIAAFSLTGGPGGNKMTAGQFMATSPDMREQIGAIDPRFDPQMLAIKDAQRRLGPQEGFEEFFKKQQEIGTALAKMFEEFKGKLPVDDLAKNMGAFAGAVGVAVGHLAALDRLPALVDQIAASVARLGGPNPALGNFAKTIFGHTPAQMTGALGGSK